MVGTLVKVELAHVKIFGEVTKTEGNMVWITADNNDKLKFFSADVEELTPDNYLTVGQVKEEVKRFVKYMDEDTIFVQVKVIKNLIDDVTEINVYVSDAEDEKKEVNAFSMDSFAGMKKATSHAKQIRKELAKVYGENVADTVEVVEWR